MHSLGEALHIPGLQEFALRGDHLAFIDGDVFHGIASDRGAIAAHEARDHRIIVIGARGNDSSLHQQFLETACIGNRRQKLRHLTRIIDLGMRLADFAFHEGGLADTGIAEHAAGG